MGRRKEKTFSLGNKDCIHLFENEKSESFRVTGTVRSLPVSSVPITNQLS